MESLRFDGSGWEYFKIWVVNILLIILTLGFYYPWAKVRNRRYFYANSILDGRNFEYHATGKQLFLGYLIALIAFIIFSSVQSISPQLTGLLFLAFFIIVPWVIWRSVSFNLRMSSFSNVRFQFDGKLGGAYLNYLILPLLLFAVFYAPFIAAVFWIPQVDANGIIVAVGLLAWLALMLYLKAMLTMRNTHYLFDNYQYGQGQFNTQVETSGFITILLKTTAIAIVLIALLSLVMGLASTLLDKDAVAGLSMLFDAQNQSDPEMIEQAVTGLGMTIIFVIYASLLFIGLAVLSYSISRQREYIYANTALDQQVIFYSSLRARDHFYVTVTNFILVILTLGFAIPWAKVRMAKLLLANTQVQAQSSLDQYLNQQQQQQSALGDQIGDAFGVNVDLAF